MAQSNYWLTRITSVPEKQSPATNPVTVTGIALPVTSVAATAARSNFTARSGIPSPLKSPIAVGAPDATATEPFSRIDPV
jgi:hypothetical protein